MRVQVQNKHSLITVLAAGMALFGLGALLLSSPRSNSQARISLGGYTAFHAGESEPTQATQAEPDLTGSVSGTLVDESNSPITGVEVELMPLDKTDEQREDTTNRDWTDAEGKYRFPRVDPGEYVLAVLINQAPDGRHPFVGSYYPGVHDEGHADRVYVATGSRLDLQTLRLQRIETVTLKIDVEFEDGIRPAWSNLLFHNPSFPHQGVIGDVAPGIKNGTGEIVLPVGFEYYARAKVDCNAGQRIESRESRPIQTLRIGNGHTPSELKFVIPGPSCPLWSPK